MREHPNNKVEDNIFLSMAKFELEVEKVSQTYAYWKLNHQVAQVTFSLELQWPFTPEKTFPHIVVDGNKPPIFD